MDPNATLALLLGYIRDRDCDGIIETAQLLQRWYEIGGFDCDARAIQAALAVLAARE